MANLRESKKDMSFWWNSFNSLIAIGGLILGMIVFTQQRALNKQHLDPKLMLLIGGSTAGSHTINVRNVGILPAREIYVRKNIYNCSKNTQVIYSVITEKPGWYIEVLTPTESKIQDISREDVEQIVHQRKIEERGLNAEGQLETVIEFYVEYRRESDFKKYSFRQMHFLIEPSSELIWSEDGRVKNDQHYINLFRAVSRYKSPYSKKLRNFDDIGKY